MGSSIESVDLEEKDNSGACASGWFKDNIMSNQPNGLSQNLINIDENWQMHLSKMKSVQ